jgi:hypothetical protein
MVQDFGSLTFHFEQCKINISKDNSSITGENEKASFKTFFIIFWYEINASDLSGGLSKRSGKGFLGLSHDKTLRKVKGMGKRFMGVS